VEDADAPRAVTLLRARRERPRRRAAEPSDEFAPSNHFVGDGEQRCWYVEAAAITDVDPTARPSAV